MLDFLFLLKSTYETWKQILYVNSNGEYILVFLDPLFHAFPQVMILGSKSIVMLLGLIQQRRICSHI